MRTLETYQPSGDGELRMNMLECIKAEEASSGAQSGEIMTTELAPQVELAYRVERELLKMPQADHTTEHDFVDGVYARTFSVPAGVLLTGAMHRHPSFFVVRSGLFWVTTAKGDKLVGPGEMIATKPGTKRILLTMTPTVITTFHANPTNETDPEKLWEMFTIPEPEGLLLESAEVMP